MKKEQIKCNHESDTYTYDELLDDFFKGEFTIAPPHNDCEFDPWEFDFNYCEKCDKWYEE